MSQDHPPGSARGCNDGEIQQLPEREKRLGFHPGAAPLWQGRAGKLLQGKCGRGRDRIGKDIRGEGGWGGGEGEKEKGS